MHNFHFDDQYNTYHSSGQAVAPEGQHTVGDTTLNGALSPVALYLFLVASSRYRKMCPLKN